MHGGVNGLDNAEYKRLRATVCADKWTPGDYTACFAMYALYVVVHLPVWALRTYTDTDARLLLAMYPMYVFTAGYMSRGVFAMYKESDIRAAASENVLGFLMLLYFTLNIVDGEFGTHSFVFSVQIPVFTVRSLVKIRNDVAWKKYVAENAKRRCYFHADCLCACDTCQTPACACPADADGACATKCIKSRHPGSERHGVDVRAYVANAKAYIIDAWAVHTMFAAVLVPFVIVSFSFYMVYAIHDDIPRLFPIIPAAHLIVAALSSFLSIFFLLLINNNTRADIARHPLGYMAYIACALVWNTMVVASTPWVFDALDGGRWAVAGYAAAHLLGHVFLYACALVGFYVDQHGAEARYVQSKRRRACTMHPECLCTCRKCGGNGRPAR